MIYIHIHILYTYILYICSSASVRLQKNMLMTKTMREAAKPKYKFALVRVRFPDGYIIQVRAVHGGTQLKSRGVHSKATPLCVSETESDRVPAASCSAA